MRIATMGLPERAFRQATFESLIFLRCRQNPETGHDTFDRLPPWRRSVHPANVNAIHQERLLSPASEIDTQVFTNQQEHLPVGNRHRRADGDRRVKLLQRQHHATTTAIPVHCRGSATQMNPTHPPSFSGPFASDPPPNLRQSSAPLIPT